MTKPFSYTRSALWMPLTAILLAAIALLVYANALDAPFVYDDEINILENPAIRMTAVTPESLARLFTCVNCPERHRYLANLSFALNYYFQGYDVRGFHAVNLAIHIVTALLIWLVARQTMILCHYKNTAIPFLAAALWLVNPVHTHSVTYTVQRMNSLAAMFYMLALFCYIRARMKANAGQGHARRITLYALSLTAAILGLASKQIVITLPAVILLYEWFFFQNLDRTWLKKQLPWMCLASLAIIALAVVYLGGYTWGNPLDNLRGMYKNQEFTMSQRLLTEPQVIVYYLSLLLFPHPARLTLDYDFPFSHALTDPVSTALAMAALAMMVIAAIRLARKHRLLSFAILWYLANLAIESSFIGLALIVEYRTYLPSAFPLIWLVCLTFSHIRPKALAIAVLCLAISVGGIWTYRRNSTWQNPVRLWQDTVAKSPANPVARSNLGYAYKNLGKLDEALDCYTRAYRQPVMREETRTTILSGLGEVLLLMDRPREALDYLTIAVRSPAEHQNHHNAHLNLGVALQRLGRTDEAMASYQRALEVNPYMEKAYNNLGNAWFLKGDATRAVNAFNRALIINPHYQEGIDNLEKIKGIMTEYGRLIDQFKTAARQQPENPPSAYQAGRISQAAGMTDQAIFWYEKALALDPVRPLYLNALGNCYAAAGRIADAARTFEQLARRIPDNATVFYNLACLYARQNEKDQAVKKLEQAVKNGYDNWPHLRTDRDLENIRDTPYYKNMVRD